ncbi:MAG: PAS domain S-box protein, partial [Candidatus Omnitrophica bacterium]|nr:PAS domain S-box protein [Candidatus Omnitrophota bacterium]
MLGFIAALVFQTIRHRKKTVSYRIQIQTSKDQIQELSRQSTELKNQLRTYSQAQEIAQIGVWESDLHSGKLTWSNPIETIFGFEPGTFPGTREAFYETVHPEDRPVVREAVNRCIQTGEAYAIKHRIVLPNRTIRWIEEQGGIQRDPAGKALTLYGIVKDITQQQLAKEEVWLFKTISEQANYGNLILDLDGSILYANNAFAQLLDQPTDTILGQSIFDLDETDRDEDSTPLFEYLHDRGELQSEEMLFRRSDGTTFPVLFNATAVTNEKGMRIYYAATAIDISDYKQAEEGLRASEQFLQSIIDSLFSSIAVLDHHGVILTVNRAWKRFADENNNRDSYYGIGKNYLRVCETAIDPDTH